MIKQEGVLKEEHTARHFSENREGGRRGVLGSRAPPRWLAAQPDSGGHLELISIMSGIM